MTNEKDLSEIVNDRKLLLSFVKEVKDRGCSLIDGWDCLSCRALEVLRSVGEEK